MLKQKGFSLIEVLLSLFLLSTLILGVVEQQRQSNQLLNQLQFIVGASHVLDTIGEQLTVKNTLPATPSPYEFSLQHKEQSAILRLTWFQNSGSLRRGLSHIRQFK